MLSCRVGSVFKSLETDLEFANRVREKMPWYRGDMHCKGSDLDEEIWECFEMQRRLVERG